MKRIKNFKMFEFVDQEITDFHMDDMAEKLADSIEKIEEKEKDVVEYEHLIRKTFDILYENKGFEVLSFYMTLLKESGLTYDKSSYRNTPLYKYMISKWYELYESLLDEDESQTDEIRTVRKRSNDMKQFRRK